jgi:hypothetical protein
MHHAGRIGAEEAAQDLEVAQPGLGQQSRDGTRIGRGQARPLAARQPVEHAALELLGLGQFAAVRPGVDVERHHAPHDERHPPRPGFERAPDGRTPRPRVARAGARHRQRHDRKLPARCEEVQRHRDAAVDAATGRPHAHAGAHAGVHQGASQRRLAGTVVAELDAEAGVVGERRVPPRVSDLVWTRRHPPPAQHHHRLRLLGEQARGCGAQRLEHRRAVAAVLVDHDRRQVRREQSVRQQHGVGLQGVRSLGSVFRIGSHVPATRGLTGGGCAAPPRRVFRYDIAVAPRQQRREPPILVNVVLIQGTLGPDHS